MIGKGYLLWIPIVLLGFASCTNDSESVTSGEWSRQELDSLNEVAHGLLDVDLDSCKLICIANAKLCRENKYPLGYARALSIQGNVFNETGKYDQAILLHRQALDIRREASDDEGVGRSYNNIGEVYNTMLQHETAIEYTDSAFNIYRDLNDLNLMSGASGNKAVNYARLRTYDSADKYFAYAVTLSEESADGDLLTSYYNYGNFLRSRGRPDTGEVFLRKALEIALRDSLHASLPGIYLSIGRSIKKRNPERAFRLFDTAVLLAQDQELSGVAEKALKSQITFLRDKGGDIDTIGLLYDSLVGMIKHNYRTQLAEDFAKYEVRYDTKQKEVELQASRAEADRRKIMNRWLWISFSLVILILGILYWNFLQKRKLAERERELKKIDEMLDFQQKERSRIGSDLHDQLGSLLGAVKLNFSSIEEKHTRATGQIDDQYSVVKKLIDNAAVEVRRISHDMSSDVLAKQGLVPAVKDLQVVLEASGKIHIEVYEHGMEDRLSSNHEIGIYRIIQELVTNTLKHANADQVDIHFTKTNEHLSVIVEDDGQGFDMEQQDVEGIGLKNIRKRVSELDGTFAMDSNPKSGTTAVLEFIV